MHDIEKDEQNMEAALKQKDVQKPPFYINRNYTLLFSGYAISVIGDVIFTTTLMLWVPLVIAKGQPWAPLALGGVTLAALLPTLLFGSLAGVFVDRWVKRTTMLRMDVLRAVLLLLLLPCSGLFPIFADIPVSVKLLIIYVVVFFAGICSQFFNPSSFALIGDIVPEEYRARATGLEESMAGLAYIVAPLIAVPLFIGMGATFAILFNALSFAISFLMILALRPPQSTISLQEGQRPNFLREYGEGLAFMVKNKVLVTVIIGAFLAVIPEGALNALGVFFYQQNLQAPITLYGLVGSASGTGGIVGALLAAFFAQRLGVGRVFGGALLCAGAVMLVYARTTSLPIALVCIFLTGLLVAAVNVAVGPLVLGVAPKELLGRIAATATSTLSISSLLSITILSSLASTVLLRFHTTVGGFVFSTYDVIFAFTGVVAMMGGAFAVYRLWNSKNVAIATAEDE
jgi:MFS family permease